MEDVGLSWKTFEGTMNFSILTLLDYTVMLGDLI